MDGAGCRHARLSWMQVEDRLACNLVFNIRNICVLRRPKYLYSQLTREAVSHMLLWDVLLIFA